jgi:enamine deaminase RidA (YjgF/YER057c/UK114 family)
MRNGAACALGHGAGEEIGMTVAGSGASAQLAEHARLGRLVVVSAVTAAGRTGGRVAGDIREQTRQALEHLGAAAHRAGVQLQRAATINVFLRDAGDFAAMNEAYAPFFPEAPPTRTTVVAGSPEPGALVAVSATIVADGEPREVVHPEGWKTSANPYSYGIRSGNALFLAGLVSRRGVDGAIVDGDVAAQTGIVLDNAREVLAAGGMTLADLVSARVFITDPGAFGPMNDVYRRTFGRTPPPTRATVVAGLMHPSHAVEITFVAMRDPKRVVLGTVGELPFSAAIVAGDGVFVSGMLGNSAGARVDIAIEAREVAARVGQVLDEAGLAWGDVRHATIYVTSAHHGAAVLGELSRLCPGGLPAGAVVETGLVVPDARVEIMVVAARAAGGA